MLSNTSAKAVTITVSVRK